MNRQTLERFPALAAAIVLHAGVIAALLLFGRTLIKPVLGPNVVSVTLVNTPANPAPAIVTPNPVATTAPPAPEVAPTPTPIPPAPVLKPVQATPKPTPKPSPKPAPVAPSKTPAPEAKPLADDSGFAGKILGDLGGAPAKPHARPPSNTASGSGAKPSPAAMASLKAQLERLWNPDCGVLGGSDVNPTIKFVLGPGGRVIGQPVSSLSGSNDKIVRVASDRAIRAIMQAQPIANLPPDEYTVNFDSKQACGAR